MTSTLIRKLLIAGVAVSAAPAEAAKPEEKKAAH